MVRSDHATPNNAPVTVSWRPFRLPANPNRSSTMQSVLRPAFIAAALSLAASAHAASTVAITEWMYNGSEFIEFTNLSGAAIDLSGWSFDDDSRIAGTVSLSGFGTLAAGESAILSEDDAATFRAKWSLADSVKVIGNNGTNLGRNDEINLYDASGALVDRLRFGDSSYVPGTIRTQDASGNPASLAVLDGSDATGWVLSSVGDAFGSRVNADGHIGNPGVFTLAPAVPEPAHFALTVSGLIAIGAIARRRRHQA